MAWKLKRGLLLNIISACPMRNICAKVDVLHSYFLSCKSWSFPPRASMSQEAPGKGTEWNCSTWKVTHCVNVFHINLRWNSPVTSYWLVNTILAGFNFFPHVWVELVESQPPSWRTTFRWMFCQNLKKDKFSAQRNSFFASLRKASSRKWTPLSAETTCWLVCIRRWLGNKSIK